MDHTRTSSSLSMISFMIKSISIKNKNKNLMSLLTNESKNNMKVARMKMNKVKSKTIP